MKKYIVNPILALTLILSLVINSCSSNDCEYVTIEDITNQDLCTEPKSVLNLSTGIDENGNVITPGLNVVDPYWRLINIPLQKQTSVSQSDQTLISSINGSSFVVNYNNASSTDWINQVNSSSISLMNAGNATQTFNSYLNGNASVKTLPFIFERSFCVSSNTTVIIDLKTRGTTNVDFELVNNETNVLISNHYTSEVLTSWNNIVDLPAGSYSIRAYNFFAKSGFPGFSVSGTIKTSDGSLVLTNNKNNCCSNNIISLTLIEDENCNNVFDSLIDTIFSYDNFVKYNASASISDSLGNVLKTQSVDLYGNIIFTGLPDGTYTINILAPPTKNTIVTPNNFQVTVMNNEVKHFKAFVCRN